MSNLFENTYNPDVVECLANLSNDEVFTPPELANKMIDLLPQELFSDPNTTFLDPACKSGIFLREIAKRLIVGLEEKIPDLQERLDHIYKKQLYGIAITELTSLLSRRSLYYTKYPTSVLSVSQFENIEGNILFHSIKHTWNKNRCKYCGASQKEFDRGDELESHAYEFIHTKKSEEIFNMKFDVIIGNPPYQLTTGSKTSQATPLYDKFVGNAKKLDPKYLIMIIPTRWYAGGMGLNKFRDVMLNDNRIKELVDYPNAKDCFPGTSISGGVCYFLWDKNYSGNCKYTNINNNNKTIEYRKLNEFNFFIRYNEAIDIVHKVKSFEEDSISTIVSSLDPFGFKSSRRGKAKSEKNNIKLYSSGGVGYVSLDDVKKGHQYLDKYNVMISKTTAEHANEPDKDGKYRIISRNQILNPNETCTFSYFLIGNFEDKSYAENLLSYIYTKFFRALLMLAVSSINLSSDKFQFVPMQDFTKPWTDEELYKKYNLSRDEIDFIESMIRPMDEEEK